MSYINEIKDILQAARTKAYRTVNAAMIEAYWLIGKRIVQEEQQGEERAGYGEGLIKEISRSLTSEFGKGFSLANLKNFRQFYQTFPEFEKSYAASSFLGWTHYRLIMRVPDKAARDYYIQEASDENWSTRTLERNIQTNSYQRLLSNGKEERKVSLPEKENSSMDEFIRDPYIFEFLNIPHPIELSEKDLESTLLDHIKQFLMELGKGFSFVGRQFRISSETSHFFIDLVFYNYILKCFVIVDLKSGKLTHQDIGQMDMYVRMFDDLKRATDDNPTVGIILCAEKDATVVKYSVLNQNRQLFASKYLTYLPSEEELKNLIEEDRILIEQKMKDKHDNEKV